MERNVVVYFGMGFLPDKNAVACREQAFGHIAQKVGYTPVLIGISENIPFKAFEKSCFCGIDCYNVKYAKTIAEKIQDTYSIEKTLIRILEDIGIERIKCFIMQDYQLRPMKKMLKYCNAHGIGFAADVMDWFTPSRDYPLVKNVFKTIDTYIRMHRFYPALNNKICITHKFQRHFCKSVQKNILVLPCTCKDAAALSCGAVDEKKNITLTFAGFLGRKCEKEKLDWLIRAMYENESTIHLNIIGLTRESFLTKMPSFADKITERIHFYGYLPRQACLGILEQSDFAVVVRKKNKVTEYGFSSKICEAFAHGIPVIATDTSDNTLYIADDVNGYVCDANYGALKSLLQKIEMLDREKIQQLRRNVCDENPLSVERYVDAFSDFMKKLYV